MYLICIIIMIITRNKKLAAQLSVITPTNADHTPPIFRDN